MGCGWTDLAAALAVVPAANLDMEQQYFAVELPDHQADHVFPCLCQGQAIVLAEAVAVGILQKLVSV